jgi:hypothetical protein
MVSIIVVNTEDDEGRWSWLEDIRILTGIWQGYRISQCRGTPYHFGMS